MVSLPEGPELHKPRRSTDGRDSLQNLIVTAAAAVIEMEGGRVTPCHINLWLNFLASGYLKAFKGPPYDYKFLILWPCGIGSWLESISRSPADRTCGRRRWGLSG